MTALESLHGQMAIAVDFRRSYIAREDNAIARRMRFLCMEDAVAQCGRTFVRSTAPPPVHPIPRSCFDQAYRLATRTGSRWIYCEGYALQPKSLGMTVHHAWVCRADAPEEAHDLAWADGTPEDTAYFGIPFQASFVREVFRAGKRRYHSVLDTWWMNYPLLTGERRIEDVMWRPE